MASMRTEYCYFRTNYYTTVYNCTRFELIILFKIINVKFRNILVNHKPLKNIILVGAFPKSKINIKISKFQLKNRRKRQNKHTSNTHMHDRLLSWRSADI